MAPFDMGTRDSVVQLGFQKRRVLEPTRDVVRREKLHPAKKHFAEASGHHGVQNPWKLSGVGGRDQWRRDLGPSVLCPCQRR
jgi:hypothetical protein